MNEAADRIQALEKELRVEQQDHSNCLHRIKALEATEAYCSEEIARHIETIKAMEARLRELGVGDGLAEDLEGKPNVPG